MHTQIVEVTNRDQNWGKFLVATFDAEEWLKRSAIASDLPTPLLVQRGWTPNHRMILDLETGEAFVTSPGGDARADLNKHKVWVCPLFEPFLEWWYQNWPGVDVGTFPDVVQLPDAEFSMVGYRRQGEDPVPAELRNWFEGKGALADRYGLPRFEIRHRVIEVLGEIGDEDNPYIIDGEIREFRTPDGAKKCRERFSKEGRTTLQQHGVLFWLRDDEIPGRDR